MIFGPVYEKFAEARALAAAGGAFSINNALELEKLLDSFFSNAVLKEKAGAASGQYVYSMKGATQKIIGYIKEKRLLINLIKLFNS